MCNGLLTQGGEASIRARFHPLRCRLVKSAEGKAKKLRVSDSPQQGQYSGDRGDQVEEKLVVGDKKKK